jgi:hypothetical protein
MRRLGPVLVTLALAATAVPSSAPAASGADAQASAKCSIRGVERKLGPTYVTSLQASGTSCASAKRLVKAFHACRKRNGGKKGRCRASVSGYRCSENRSGIATQFSAKVRCRRGGSSVVHTYTQFT